MSLGTGSYRSVLFDLDGTLVDTAPDMARVLFDMLDAHGAPPLGYPLVRSMVSNGSLALVKLGFPDASEARHLELQTEYLERYERNVCGESTVFAGLLPLLDWLDDESLPWGIVTNKPERMTSPLLRALELTDRAACAVSGDTLPQRKPDPAPLLYASRLTRVPPSDTVYVGDAARDIAAGRAAGMATVAAAYGYVTADDDPQRWQADVIAANTEELSTIVAKAVSLGTR